MLECQQGGYRFLKGGRPYSAGVVAAPGFEIVHARFAVPPALADGFEAVAAHVESLGRPKQALCAMELRCRRPMTIAEFKEFNDGYRNVLREWGVLVDDVNPVVRTNVSPVIEPPPETVLYGFSYAVVSNGAGGETFVISGAGERGEGTGKALDIVRYGETSADAMAEKALSVRNRVSERLEGLGAAWNASTAVNVYTAHACAAPEVLGERPVTWHYARPPIVHIEFEMDARRYRREVVL